MTEDEARRIVRATIEACKRAEGYQPGDLTMWDVDVEGIVRAAVTPDATADDLTIAYMLGAEKCRSAVRAAVLAERERCAKIAEQAPEGYRSDDTYEWLQTVCGRIAATIRAEPDTLEKGDANDGR